MSKMAVAALAAAALVATVALGGSSPARAEIEYPWCAVYKSDLGTNCGFVSMDQCLAAIFGIGGFCYPNSAYPGPSVIVPQPQPPRDTNR